MTKPDNTDRLEQQLAALRPLGPSVGLHERIAKELRSAASPPSPTGSEPWQSYQRWRRGAAALCVAACAASLALVAVGLFTQQPASLPAPPAAIPQTTTSPQGPTLWNYRSAFLESSQQFGEMLDRHAATLLPTTPEFAFAP